MLPRIEAQRIATFGYVHFQVVPFVHITVDIHFLFLCCFTSFVVVEVVGGHGEVHIVIKMIMTFGRPPVAVHGFVVHHHKERLVPVAVFQPVYGLFGDNVRHVSVYAYRIVLGDEVGVIVFSLIVQDSPIIKSGRLRHQMPFTDQSGLITVRLEYLLYQ